MGSEFQNFFDSIIAETADTNSGWCGSNTLACNILLRSKP